MVRQPDDMALLRRFEPVMRYTRGERFFPMDVTDYVRECSLWMQQAGTAPRCLLREGELTLESLGEPRNDGFDAVYFLQFIEPLHLAELARYQLEQTRRKKRDAIDVFQVGQGRLARVGYTSRLIDALFSLTLFTRGRVPGDTAAAAALTYRRIMDDHPHTCYYGRVVRENGWIVLQYWFFYPYNNWRSGFFGVNDHEADWEQVSMYAYQNDAGDIHPRWVAYASHDYAGDDLRRRWDDPEVEKVGEHPVVYPGAGSHASYYQPGEYLTEIELPFLRPLVRLADRLREARDEALEEYWGAQLNQQRDRSEINIFHIPFVDYARGDGRGIGPGEERAWSEPRLLNPVPDWALLYRGLWGLYAQDPLSGEDAPAGPMYNRDGSVRRAWYDPTGWAGLDKVPPPSMALERAYEERAAILNRRDDLAETIETTSAELLRLGVEQEAMRGLPHLKPLFDVQREQMAGLSHEIDEARARLTQDEALLEALDHYIEQIREGRTMPLRAHIQRAHAPISDESVRLGRVAELWAASSIGLVMLGVVALVVFEEPLWIGLAIMGSIILFFEAVFRRWLGQLLTFVTVVLALVAGGILVVQFFRPIALVLVMIVGVYLLLDNFRELWS